MWVMLDLKSVFCCTAITTNIQGAAWRLCCAEVSHHQVLGRSRHPFTSGKTSGYSEASAGKLMVTWGFCHSRLCQHWVKVRIPMRGMRLVVLTVPKSQNPSFLQCGQNLCTGRRNVGVVATWRTGAWALKRQLRTCPPELISFNKSRVSKMLG